MTRDAERFLMYVGVGLALILCVVSLISGLGSGSSAVGEDRTYEVEGEVLSLEVEIGAADFRIEKGEEFFVESNLKRLTFRQIGDKLVLRESSFGNKKYNGAYLTIYIPDGTVFDEIDITTGAGKFAAETLLAEKVSLELGAGEVNIGELIATREAKIEGGAGAITIDGGSLKNPSFEMGVGEFRLITAIIGEGKFDLGIGEANMTLIGGRENYTVEINKGIGDISFDGDSIPGGKTIGNGQNHIEINGGIGAIKVEFE